MVAGLLYLIGLISVVISLVLIGVNGPSMYYALVNAYNAGLPNVWPAIVRITTPFGWAFWPIVGGLLLMGYARIIMLLASINRRLRIQG